MSDFRNPARLGRSIFAVFMGFIAVVVLSLVTDVVLHKSGVYPPWDQAISGALAMLATVYRTVYGVAGSYITARLAPNRPMQHALAGGVVGSVLSIAGTLATWNLGLGPHWYPLALIVLAIPTAWVGGKSFLMQSHGRVGG